MTPTARPLMQHLLLTIASAIVAGGAHGVLGLWPSANLWLTALLGAAITLVPIAISPRARTVVPVLALAQAVCHGVFMAPTMAVTASGVHCAGMQLAPGAQPVFVGPLLDVTMLVLHTAAVVALWAGWRHAEHLVTLLALAVQRLCRVPQPFQLIVVPRVWQGIPAPVQLRGHRGHRLRLQRGPPLAV